MKAIWDFIKGHWWGIVTVLFIAAFAGSFFAEDWKVWYISVPMGGIVLLFVMLIFNWLSELGKRG